MLDLERLEVDQGGFFERRSWAFRRMLPRRSRSHTWSDPRLSPHVLAVWHQVEA